MYINVQSMMVPYLNYVYKSVFVYKHIIIFLNYLLENLFNIKKYYLFQVANDNYSLYLIYLVRSKLYNDEHG